MRSGCYVGYGTALLLLHGLLIGGSPALSQSAEGGQQAEGPEIVHEPLRSSLRGEDISLMAEVLSDTDPITGVTLHYTVSRHAAPVKVRMRNTGMSLYNATIPGVVTKQASNLYYYIEAETEGEAWTESPWHTVEITAPKTGAPSVPAGRAQQTASKKRQIGTIALIAGGAAGIVAGALALADNGGGGGGSNGGGGAPVEEDVAGTYTGTEVLCFTPEGGDTTCETLAITVEIDEMGLVDSNDLAGGTPASGSLSGDRFAITVPAGQLDPGSLGEVLFEGIVRDGVISGTISGAAETSVGPGTFSGTFTATRI